MPRIKRRAPKNTRAEFDFNVARGNRLPMVAPFQFSIRFVLVLTAAVAVAVTAVSAEPTLLSACVINFLTIAFTTAAIIATIQTGGKLRSFWVGTAVVLGPASHVATVSSLTLIMSIAGGWANAPQGLNDSRFLWPLWCAAPLNGLAAVVLHGLFTFSPMKTQDEHKAAQNEEGASTGGPR